MVEVKLGFKGSRGGELKVRTTPLGEIGILESEPAMLSIYWDIDKLESVIKALREAKLRRTI